MIGYSKVNAKLSDMQWNNLKTAVKNKTGTTLRMNIKMFGGNSSPHELLLTRRLKTKLRNARINNMLSDIKLPKAHISKIIRSAGVLESINESCSPFGKNVLAPLGITVFSSAIDVVIQNK